MTRPGENHGAFDQLHQTLRLSAAETKAEAAQGQAERLQYEVKELKRRCDALTLGSQAMWELLRERTGLTDEAISEKILEIDLRDGVADGKSRKGRMQQCSSCGHGTNAARQTCLYCGAALPALPGENVFGKR